MKRILLICFVLVSTLFNQALAQERTVSGTVTSTMDGYGLPGVNVTVKGTPGGTLTDIDGKYTINVSGNEDVIVFSFVGMETQEVVVGSRSAINVTLDEGVQQLTEVVVTGVSDMERKKITSSITTVEAKSIQKIPVASFEQILQGQSSGLYINAGSGQPGTAATVRIRGNGSIQGGNDPLYVLDGVPIEADVFASLNSNDFESVNILKDAAATSLYGSRGANGVIVITSKKGKAGKTRVNYSYQRGFSEPGSWKFDMMDTEQILAFEEIAQNGLGWKYSANNPANEGNLEWAKKNLDSLRNINADWLDVVSQQGTTETHEVNVSGGKENTRFYISGSYFSQEGVAKGSALERFTGRFNIDHDATDKLRFGLSSTVGASTGDLLYAESINTGNPFVLASMIKPYNNIFDPETGETYKVLFSRHPLDMVENFINQREELKAVVSANAALEIIPGLTAKTRVGLDFRDREYTTYADPDGFVGSDAGVTNGGQGYLRMRDNTQTQTQWFNSLTYDKTFGKHSINALVGTEMLRKNYNQFGFRGYGLSSKLGVTPAAITDGTPTNGFIPEISNLGYNVSNALMSYFAIANYSFDDKYNLSVSARRDGSSKFGSNYRYANLWSVGGSWNIKEEDFMAGVSFLDNLKLRASYGVSGNQDDTDVNVASFDSRAQYSLASYDGAIATYPSEIGNADLKWELSTQTNIGIDFAMFNNRVSGSVDLYNNITSDLFVNKTLSWTAGQASIDYNDGKMRNRGIELSLKTVNVRTRDFEWSTNFNFSYNDNEVLDLGQVEEYESGTSIIREGLPLGTHYAVGFAGVNPANGQPLYTDKDGNVTTVYDVANSRAVYGTYNPPIVGGLTNSITFKGITLSALFSAQQGHTLFNNNKYFTENHAFGSYNQSTKMLEIWQKPGDITDVQGAAYEREFSSKDVEDASFIRLRNIRLSYDLPSSLMKKTRVFERLNVYAQAQNLHTWTKFTGFDPEVGNNISQFNYPTPRIITFGLEVGF